MHDNIRLPKTFRSPLIAILLSLTLADCAETIRQTQVSAEIADASHSNTVDTAPEARQHILRKLRHKRLVHKPHKLRKKERPGLSIRTAQLIYFRNPPSSFPSFDTKMKTIYGTLDNISGLLRNSSHLRLFEEFNNQNNLNIFAIIIEKPIPQPDDPTPLPEVE